MTCRRAKAAFIRNRQTGLGDAIGGAGKAFITSTARIRGENSCDAGHQRRQVEHDSRMPLGGSDHNAIRTSSRLIDDAIDVITRPLPPEQATLRVWSRKELRQTAS